MYRMQWNQFGPEWPLAWNRLGAWQPVLGASSSQAPQPSSNLGIPPLDILETDVAFQVELELPGMTRDQVKIHLEKGILTLSGERPHLKMVEGTVQLKSEQLHGTFKRSLRLPDSVDTDGIRAALNEGVLRITVPKTKPAQAKTIELEANS